MAFQLVDRLAGHGLGDAVPLRCLGETVQADYITKNYQRFDLHALNVEYPFNLSLVGIHRPDDAAIVLNISCNSKLIRLLNYK